MKRDVAQPDPGSSFAERGLRLVRMILPREPDGKRPAGAAGLALGLRWLRIRSMGFALLDEGIHIWGPVLHRSVQPSAVARVEVTWTASGQDIVRFLLHRRRRKVNALPIEPSAWPRLAEILAAAQNGRQVFNVPADTRQTS